MSSGTNGTKKNQDFIDRFVEACGSTRPSDIHQLLGIRYQTVRNYLHGRLPSAEKLILISDRTSCSIDWLLTGRGKKFIDTVKHPDTPQSSRQIESFVRSLVEVMNDEIGKQAAHLSTVTLQSSDLLSEKVLDDPKALPGRKFRQP